MARWFVIFAAVLVCAAGSVQAKVFDNYIEMYAAKYIGESGIGYEGGVDVGIEGLSDSSLSLAGVNIGNSNWGGYEEMDFDGEEYYVESDSDQSFEDLGINGTWYIDVVTNDGVNTYHSVYTWTISGITEDTWNAIPDITSHENGDTETNLRPTFTWTVDSVKQDAILLINTQQFNEDGDWLYENEEQLDPNTLLAWTPGFDLSCGSLEFMVGYVMAPGMVVSYDETESGLLGTPGGDIVAWASTEEYFVAGDSIEIEIVPEPATISMLGLGALAIIRSRRKKS